MNDDGHSMPPIRNYLMGGLIALTTLVVPILSVTFNTHMGINIHQRTK